MSKYEELLAKREAARQAVVATWERKPSAPDSDDGSEINALRAAEIAVKFYERTAASLIERAREAIRETCRLCPLATHGCKRCERREECEGVKLLAEMEAL